MAEANLHTACMYDQSIALWVKSLTVPTAPLSAWLLNGGFRKHAAVTHKHLDLLACFSWYGAQHSVGGRHMFSAVQQPADTVCLLLP